MTGPQYVNDLSDVYTRMYNHPGHERPLNERFEPSRHTNREVEEDKDPNWKKVLQKHAKKQKRHMGPTIADVPRDDIPDAHEEGEEENSKANLAIKLVLELIGEAEHNDAAAKALNIIRDLVK